MQIQKKMLSRQDLNSRPPSPPTLKDSLYQCVRPLDHRGPYIECGVYCKEVLNNCYKSHVRTDLNVELIVELECLVW